MGSFELPDLASSVYKYHCMIVHSSSDDDEVNQLRETLMQAGVVVSTANHDFIPGYSILANIEDLIKKSRRIIAYITKNSLESSFVLYELNVAMVNAAATRRSNLILLLGDGISESTESFPTYLIPYNFVKVNEPDYMSRLMSAITGVDKDFGTELPAQNAGIGLAWSYYFGYLDLVLPSLQDRVSAVPKIWDDDLSKRRVVPKLFILMPFSGDCKTSLSECDPPHISEFCQLEPLIISRAGNFKRNYNNHVYKISKDDKVYFCVAEFATPILTLRQMEHSQIAGMDGALRRREIATFYQKLDEILNCYHLHAAKGKAVAFRHRILHYDDNDGILLSDRLIGAIEKDLEDEKKYSAYKQTTYDPNNPPS